jgi:hypothetical protein
VCSVAWVDRKDAPKPVRALFIVGLLFSFDPHRYSLESLVSDAVQEGLLTTPLYMASDRGRVVANLTLPCEKSAADKWVRAAIALFMKDL